MQNKPSPSSLEALDESTVPDSVPSDPPLNDGLTAERAAGSGSAPGNADNGVDGGGPDRNGTGKEVAKASAGIGALHLLRFLIGFAAQPLIARNFGLQWHADAYTVSTDIIQRIWLLFEKVINPAFLPNFIKALKEEGEERAWLFASAAIWVVSLTLLIVTPLCWLGMPALVELLSQKAGREQIDLTIHLSRWLLAGLFCLGLSSLTYTILNGYKRFVMAALGDALWKLAILIGALVAYKMQLAEEIALWVIVGGFIVGSMLKLLPHVVAIGSKWRLLRPAMNLRDPLVVKMGWLALPLLLGILVSEVRGFYLLHLADDESIRIEASRAALKWSGLIGNNLIQIFPYAMSIGLFPYLADMARNRDRQPLTDTLVSALRACVFFFAPVTAIMIALRLPLLRAVWESGRMTQADTVLMSAPFVAFTLGLVGFACEMQLGQTYYAMTKAWTPTVIGICTSLLWVVLATVGVQNLGWGLAAMAGAESIAKSVKCVVMWCLLRPHLGKVNRLENLVFAGKMLVGSLLAAWCSAWIASFLSPDSAASASKMVMLLRVVLAGTCGMGVFLAFASITRTREMELVTQATGKVARKIRGKRAR